MMTKSQIRNSQFAQLIACIKDLPFGKQLLILQAFAKSHNLKFMFDSESYSMYTLAGAYGKKVADVKL